MGSNRARCVRCACGACVRLCVRVRIRSKWGRGAAAVALALGVTLAGCNAESDRGRGQVYDARAQIELSRAEATRVAISRQIELDRLEVTSRQTAAAVEQAGRVARLEAERKSAEAQGDAQVRELESTGQAKAVAIKTAGYAGAAVLVAVALAVVILAGGWSAATTRKAWAEAQLLTIGVEQSTLLPPPFVVTADGYLVDTRSGERARLRDAAGVNRLRLQTSADVTKAALGARAAAEIARATGRPEDGAGLLLPPQKGGNHGTV